jgi:hypothetical protein
VFVGFGVTQPVIVEEFYKILLLVLELFEDVFVDEPNLLPQAS